MTRRLCLFRSRSRQLRPGEAGTGGEQGQAARPELDPTATFVPRGYIAAHLGCGLYLIEPDPETDPIGSGDLFTAVDDAWPNRDLRAVIIRPGAGGTSHGC
ncbi:hypothetical protein BCD49_32805 [Pseudofrankia sp. EUN1h]|nr:hypothetical protein BCD49_32805 [Pseudofrankia sp. EUN1h]